MAELDLLRAVADTEGSPARHACQALAIMRREGYAFEDAWTLMKRVMARGPNAMAAGQITNWKAIIEAQKETWRAAYDGTVPPDALEAGAADALDLATSA